MDLGFGFAGFLLDEEVEFGGSIAIPAGCAIERLLDLRLLEDDCDSGLGMEFGLAVAAFGSRD